MTLLSAPSLLPQSLQPKSKAKAKASGAKTVKNCLCCESPCQKGSKFCQLHKRSADAMTYQAKTQGEEATAVVKGILADDARARQEDVAVGTVGPCIPLSSK